MIVGHFNDVMSQIITPDKNLSLNKSILLLCGCLFRQSVTYLHSVYNFHCLEVWPTTEKKKHQVNDASIAIKRRSEESNYICEYCENKLALCIDPCFRLHHSNLQIKIPDAVEDEGNNMV